MDDIGREKVRRAAVKLGCLINPELMQPQIEQARRVLDELELELTTRDNPISMLSICSMTVEYLESAGIHTIDQLDGLSDLDLLGVDRMGPKRVHEVRSALVVWKES